MGSASAKRSISEDPSRSQSRIRRCRQPSAVNIGATPSVDRSASTIHEAISVRDSSRKRFGELMPASLLDKRETRIRRMFGDIAPRYDLLNHLLSLNVDRSWRKRTTRLVPPQGDAPILDLCTGTGDLALTYDKAAGGRVPIVGADFCHPMLVRAIDKTARRQSSGRVRYVEADAQQLPFADDTFQIVCVAFGLRNVTDTDRGLAEMA